ncbi:formate dehydrogenase subunit alpha [Methanorbis furvi]|uniref:Formate dehydrogenase H n=1 Tax=Methanorbis furvi TaxID=3028299 RepID=A0AAE4SAM6_9EURY|nr:Formate dehydrogenase H [Methanocorpusculaceae archaeon Ag1]
MNLKYVPTTCPYCGTGCSFFLVVRDGRLVGVAPRSRSPVNEGKLCPRGMAAWEFVASPERLTHPLIRKNGELVPATWNEAITLIAEKFRQYQPSECCVLSSPRTSNEDNYVMMKFARGVLKTNHIDHCERLCHASIVDSLADSFGHPAMTGSIPDLAKAKCIFVIGSNAFAQHPLIGRKIIEAQRSGATYICADPRKTFTGSQADLHLQFHAGTDIMLLNGIMHEILLQKLENTEFIAERTNGFDEFREIILQPEYSAENVAESCGVPAEKIRATAKLMALPGCAVIYSSGITKQGNSAENIHSLANLQLLTGNVGRAGTGVHPLRGQNNIQGACDMGAQPFYFTGYQRVEDADVHKKFEEAWSFSDGIAPAKTGYEITEMMDSLISKSGELKAMYIMGENPVLSDLDINHAKAALEQLEFLVVQDIFLNETAGFADVVLPAVCFAERDGTQTNTERRVQRWHKACEPPGEAKADWEIIASIASAMGYAEQFSWKTYAEVFDELASLTPPYAGISYDRLASADSIQWPCPSGDHSGTQILYTDTFATADGRAVFLPAVRQIENEKTDEQYPFLFTTGRCIFHWDTGSMTRKSSAANTGNWLEINTADAKKLEISTGDSVRLITHDAEISATARVTEEILPGTLFMPSHYVEFTTKELVQNTMPTPGCGGRSAKIEKII